MATVFESKVLRTALERAHLFVETNGKRPVLGGVRIDLRPGVAHVIGCDGHALGAARIEAVEGAEHGEVILPGAAVSRIVKWLPKTGEHVTLDVSGDTLTLTLASGGTVTEGGLADKYPSITGLVATYEPTEHRAMLDAPQIARLAQAAMIGHRKTDRVPVRIVTHDPLKPTVCVLSGEDFAVIIMPLSANWEGYDFGREAARIMGTATREAVAA